MSTSKEIAKFADESMFVAEEAPTDERGDHRPIVTLIEGPSDPLGQLAYFAKAYQGVFPKGLESITDEDRRYYIDDIEKNVLGMPAESVMFNFQFQNVTRAWTHQLVRTRHASYAQESMRFAVKEDFPTQLPPSMFGTLPRRLWREDEVALGGPVPSAAKIQSQMEAVVNRNTFPEQFSELVFSELDRQWEAYEEQYASKEQRARFSRDASMESAKAGYEKEIALGIPAEDARGVAPHAIVTKINMAISLRALKDMAGQRLCTQAQFEHREVWNGIRKELIRYGKTQHYFAPTPDDRLTEEDMELAASEKSQWNSRFASLWQYEKLATKFLPICYQTGSCKFGSDFDRFCSIRDRVNLNTAAGRPSSDWHLNELVVENNADGSRTEYLGIPAILPHEWLDPKAAIAEDATWRSDEALANIEGRRL